MAQSHLIKGNLSGYICDDCTESISNVTIRLYYPSSEGNLTAAAIADPKETFRGLSSDGIRAKQERLFAEGRTDQEGNFSIQLNDTYHEAAFEIDFLCSDVPNASSREQKQYAERQFHLTTVYPKWRQSGTDLVFAWKYAVPARWWCFIRGVYFDAWTICGHLTDCGTGKPLSGFTVKAMDADWITDDFLGSAITNDSGYFRINYSSADFKRTFLSPLLNIETDPTFPFSSGPDVYFTLEYNGTPIVLETAANRRTNVGHCLCVHLCLKDFVPPIVEVPAAFTHIGRAERHHIQAGINPITGKTLGGLAFYSSIKLIGVLNPKLGGQPMEYMFEYQEVAMPTTPLVEANWKPVTPGMINETVIGARWYFTGDPANPVTHTYYAINKITAGYEAVVINDSNWFQMPQFPNFFAHQDDIILDLNTAAITGTATIDMNGMTIGSPTIPGVHPEVTNRYIALRMQQRKVGSSTKQVAGTSRPFAIFNATYNNVPHNGSWAPRKVNGQQAAVSMDVVEIKNGGGCGKITSQLHVKYNARHENLGTISLSMYGPTIVDEESVFAPLPVTPPESVSIVGGVEPLIDVSTLPNCAYTIFLKATVKLTTGDGGPGEITDFVSICKG